MPSAHDTTDLITTTIQHELSERGRDVAATLYGEGGSVALSGLTSGQAAL